METTGKQPRVMSRGLLTKAEREFLRGEKENVDESQYRYNIRSNFRSRMAELETDLELLRDGGEAELAEEFHNSFSRMDRLEREVERLRDELDQERED